MKKVLIFMILFCTNITAIAQSKEETIASIPFRGDGLNDDEREYLASIFVGPFTSLGYTFVSRTSSQKIVSSELNYQRTGSTSDAAEVGKQLKADWVLVGSLVKVFGKYKMSVEIIDVETAKILGSDTRNVDGMENINGTELIVDMARKVDAQIKRDEYVSTEQKEQILKDELIEKLENTKTLKWVGRGMWIGGLLLSTTTVIVDAGMSSEAFHFMTATPQFQTHASMTDPFGNIIGTRTTTTGIYTETDITVLKSIFWTGIGLALVGAGMDIYFSLTEKKLSNDLYLSFTPYIIPQQNAGMDIGCNFMFAYRF